MSDDHPAQPDYQEWWPGGHDRWIRQAMSIEQLVRAAFLAGWDARNSRLTAMALRPGDTGMTPALPQRMPVQWMPAPGPPPVSRLSDYPNLSALTKIRDRIEAITPAPGQPDPAATRDLPAVSDETDPRDATFERLNAAWTEEYGPSGPVPTIPGLSEAENG